MLTYANGVALAISHQENELILEFTQRSPVFERVDGENTITNVAEAPAVQIAMTAAKGHELLLALQRLYPSES